MHTWKSKKLSSTVLCLAVLVASLYSRNIRRKLVLSSFLPLFLFIELGKLGAQLSAGSYFSSKSQRISDNHVQETAIAGESEFRRILNHIGDSGARTTGSEAHNKLIDWIAKELCAIPGISIETEEFEIKRWQTRNGVPLKDAAKLTLGGSRVSDVPIAGAVPFSSPTSCIDKEMIYLPRNTKIQRSAVAGRIILRDFPIKHVPYAVGLIPSYFRTFDVNADLLSDFEHPGSADGPLCQDLLEADAAGAAGMIVMFDIVQEQVASYFEPHKGMHYQIPAVFVGIDAATVLRAEAVKGTTASISVEGEASPATTRNIVATLTGQSKERVIYVTHTDGNTFVQENGPVALLILAQYYAKQPLDSRRRTLQFAFNTGHLHISREGSARHAAQLDEMFEDGSIGLVIAVEHLGTREIKATRRLDGGPGRTLQFSGRGEAMFWGIGPIPIVVQAVKAAAKRRELDRVIVTRGTGMPDFTSVPTYTSLGGIGTYYHNNLVPTTSLISGPWSLWAPWFGREAVDVERLRKQTLALGDIYLAVDDVPLDLLIGKYRDQRRIRASGGKAFKIELPPEQSTGSSKFNM